MLRVVIDTSSLVSYVLTRGDIRSQVVAHWRASSFRLLSTSATRAELAAVLQRPRIRRLAVAPLDELAAGLDRFSHHVAERLDLPIPCRDPNDVKFVLCAVEGRAHYLVSSDQDLLAMRHYRGVAFVNPGQFLLALELHSMSEGEMAERFGRQVLSEILDTVPLEPETAARLKRAARPRGRSGFHTRRIRPGKK